MAASTPSRYATGGSADWVPPESLEAVPKALWVMARLCPANKRHEWQLQAVEQKVVHAALKDKASAKLVTPHFDLFIADAEKGKSLGERKSQLVRGLKKHVRVALGTGTTDIGMSLRESKRVASTGSRLSALSSRGNLEPSDSAGSLASMAGDDRISEALHEAKGTVGPVDAARMLSRGRLGGASGQSGLIVYAFRTMHRLAANLVRVANGHPMAFDTPEAGASAASASGASGPGGLVAASSMGSPGHGAGSAAEPAHGHAALRTASWRRFADGWPDITLDRVKDGRYNSVALILDLRKPETLFEQLCVLYTLPKEGCISLTVVVPFFPGQSDRVNKSGEVATAWILARLISSLPPCASGPTQLVILDIHALQERHFFGDSVHVRLRSCVGLLREKLLRGPASELAIAWPDDGAAKRFSSHFVRCGQSVFPLVICHKRREGDRRVVRIAEGDPSGKVVCIVDDLVQTGGTLLQCAEALYEAGATRVMAYVTHAVFPGRSWERFTAEPYRIDPFYITDTIPEMAERLSGVRPFEVLSVAPVLADMLALDEDE